MIRPWGLPPEAQLTGRMPDLCRPRTLLPAALPPTEHPLLRDAPRQGYILRNPSSGAPPQGLPSSGSPSIGTPLAAISSFTRWGAVSPHHVEGSPGWAQDPQWMALDLLGGWAQRPAPRPRSPLLIARWAQDKARGTAWPPHTSSQIHPCGSVLPSPSTVTFAPYPPARTEDAACRRARTFSPVPCGPQ